MSESSRARFRPVLAGCLCGLALAASLTAETWKGLDLKRKLDNAAWKWGPFRVQPSFVLSNVGVDSNVFYSPTDPIKDFTLTVGPAATIYFPMGRKLVLWAYGSPQYVWYAQTAQERTWNYYFNGATQLSLKNIFFSLDGLYNDARERWNSEIDYRPRRKETGYGASALVKLAWKTSFSLGYRSVKYDYQSVVVEGGSDLRLRLNRTEDYGNLSVFYQLTTQNRFFVDLEYGRYDFEFAEQAALSNSQSRAVYGGFEFSPLGRRVRGRVRLGYKDFNVLNPEMEDYKGLVGDTRISVRLNNPIAIRASYLGDVQFSTWYNNPYYVESRLGLGASLYPLRFLRLDYDYSKGQNRYPEAGGGQVGVKRLDDITVHSAGVYVRITKKAALGVITSWWNRDSNINTEDDRRAFLGLNLTYDF
jgi:hypothetical protein